MMKMLKITLSSFQNNSRNLREMETAQEAGFNVSVLCDKKTGTEDEEYIKDYQIKRIALFDRNKPLIIMFIHSIPGLIKWIAYIRQSKADVISCHDLIPLVIAYIARFSLVRRNRPLLIYDSHELELERAPNERRRPWMKKMLYLLEKYLVKRVEAILVVSESISDYLENLYRLDKKPIVVRNIPHYWVLDASICNRRRKELNSELGHPGIRAFMIYWGLIAPGRGIENLIEVLELTKEIALVLMGPVDRNYLDIICQKADSFGVRARLLFKDAVPAESIWQYAGAADVSMVTIPHISKSYYFMLPNKLFESIQSLTPVVASDFPEVTNIIKSYGVGLAVKPDKVEEIAAAVEKVCYEKEFRESLRDNLLKAKEELCWEHEKNKLLKLYTNLAHRLKQQIQA
jgi:glycosyltransferase involved in cell wall biosynthesis